MPQLDLRRAASRGLAAELRELLEELSLLALEIPGDADADGEEQITASTAIEVGDAAALQPDDRARLGAGLDPHPLGAIERVDFNVGAERRLHHRDIERRHHVL